MVAGGDSKGGAARLAGLDLHPSLIPALRKCGVHGLTAMQKSHMEKMMTGQDYLFGMPHDPMTFIIPTVQLLMNYPKFDARSRVAVLSSQKEEVDQVVADYMSLTTFLPGSGIAPEGIHSSRLSNYATPINYQAPVVVGTTAKLARSIQSGQLDVSAVDAVIIVRGERIANGRERRSAGEVYHVVSSIKGVAPQLVVFADPAQMSVTQTFVDEIKDRSMVSPKVLGSHARSAPRDQ